MALIKVNNKGYIGDNMKIINGKIIIDGVDINCTDSKISIVVEGNINTLDVDVCSTIDVGGNVENLKGGMGSINIKGNVNSDVKSSMGSITCNDVAGNVRSDMGSIKILGKANGEVKSNMGKIKYN